MSKRTDKTEKEPETDALEKTTTEDTAIPSFTFQPLEQAMEEENEGIATLSGTDDSGTDGEPVTEDSIEYDHEQDATDDEVDEVDEADEADEADETAIIPTLLREGPVSRPERHSERNYSDQADDVAERAVSGKMPSMREPRKKRSGEDSVTETRNPLSSEDNTRILREMKERELAAKLKRDERKEPEIVIPDGTFNLKEDIQIELTQDAIKSILVQAINNKYKKEGLQVNPNVDDELYIESVNVMNVQQITAFAKLSRIPVTVKREFIDG